MNKCNELDISLVDRRIHRCQMHVEEDTFVDLLVEIVANDQLYQKDLPAENDDHDWAHEMLMMYLFHSVDHRNESFAFDKQDQRDHPTRSLLLPETHRHQRGHNCSARAVTCFRWISGDFLVKCWMKLSLIFLAFSSTGELIIEFDRVECTTAGSDWLALIDSARPC